MMASDLTSSANIEKLKQNMKATDTAGVQTMSAFFMT